MNFQFGRQSCFQSHADVWVTEMEQLRRVRLVKRHGAENVVLSLLTKKRKSLARWWEQLSYRRVEAEFQFSGLAASFVMWVFQKRAVAIGQAKQIEPARL